MRHRESVTLSVCLRMYFEFVYGNIHNVPSVVLSQNSPTYNVYFSWANTTAAQIIPSVWGTFESQRLWQCLFTLTSHLEFWEGCHVMSAVLRFLPGLSHSVHSVLTPSLPARHTEWYCCAYLVICDKCDKWMLNERCGVKGVIDLIPVIRILEGAYVIEGYTNKNKH